MNYNKRTANSIKILKAMSKQEYLSRRELAEETGLTERTVSVLCNILRKNELILIGGRGPKRFYALYNDRTVSLLDLLHVFDPVTIEDEKMRGLFMAALEYSFIV